MPLLGLCNPRTYVFAPLGRVFKLYIYLSVALDDPPQPPLKRGENRVKVSLF